MAAALDAKLIAATYRTAQVHRYAGVGRPQRNTDLSETPGNGWARLSLAGALPDSGPGGAGRALLRVVRPTRALILCPGRRLAPAGKARVAFAA